jgi:hypothetical protein
MACDRMAATYKRCASVIAREIAGETLLVPITGALPDMQQIYALDEVSRFVWERLDGTQSLLAIVDAVVGDFDVTADVAEEDVKRFIRELSEHHLVEQV